MLKPFQLHDLARAALVEGLVLAWDTGTGKSWAMFLWPLLKVGHRFDAAGLHPLAPVLIVAPADLHDQLTAEAKTRFHIHVQRLPDQTTYEQLRQLSTPLPNPQSAIRNPQSKPLPPGFYLASYTELTSNGVKEFPGYGSSPEFLFNAYGLTEADAKAYYDDRANHHGKAYRALGMDPNGNTHDLEDALKEAKRWTSNQKLIDTFDDRASDLNRFHCNRRNCTWEQLPTNNRARLRDQLARLTHEQIAATIGKTSGAGGTPALPGESAIRNSQSAIKCVFSPSLVDLCGSAFRVVVLDEGTRIQNQETITAEGLAELDAPYRMVLTATPIKNRLPSVFNLICWALRISDTATARFPYSQADLKTFAEEFLVSETNLTRMEAETGTRRSRAKRWTKPTPQACNVHRLWKLFGPIILRRTKLGLKREAEQTKANNMSKQQESTIVNRIMHIVRVPMGTDQKEVYEFHLCADYKDKNGQPALGAKLQALRLAAADPSSKGLKDKED